MRASQHKAARRALAASPGPWPGTKPPPASGMERVVEVPIEPAPLERFVPIVGEAKVDEALAQARYLRDTARDRTIWNVNSTAAGGGVAEMLRSLLAYARGTG